MHRLRLSDVHGFSLIELVIVVVILGLIAGIAIPRFTQASRGSAEAALRADLKMLREAIDLYAAEHNGDWPSLRAAGDEVGPQNGEAFKRQLTWYTAENGEASRTKDATYYLGPYLWKIPPLPVGSRAGKDAVATINYFSTPGIPGPDYGWEVEHYFGRIRANLPLEEVGFNGIPYCEW